MGHDMSCPNPCPNDYQNAMNVVRHYYKFPQPDIRKMVRDLGKIFMGNLADLV